jgi:lipopolysaccharide transport system ATP-binding protein
MSSPIIKVENLSKCYRVGHLSTQREQYTALRDVIARNLRSAWRKTSDLVHGRQILQGDEVEDFWALKDVSFEIQPGEVVGIIGRNGAGKSTLLKILSRITEPTSGRITLNGRVASLLEVGTGFHPELSGRENVYLNGAILGMSRLEVTAKFDEIVAFAEVERFLETPVKRYSSGMYVRLAFAVAAHLEPEILVVDEVLAVGDNAFQRKCLGKMDDVAKSGRTVLFVSHNMTTVQNLCNRAIVLKAGHVELDGDCESAISSYSESARQQATLPDPGSRRGNGKVRVLSIDIQENAKVHGAFGISFVLGVHAPIESLEFRIGIYASNGLCVCAFGNSITGTPFTDLQPGQATIRLDIPRLPLNTGHYTMNVSLSADMGSNELFDVIESATNFLVEGGDPFGTGRLPTAGATVLDHQWSMERRAA